jgi:CheY-like chemotaxis protein
VLFPVHEGAENETTSLPRDLVKGKGRILFVDDEEAIVSLGKGILKRLGYEVVGTTSSLDALEIFKSRQDAFDLVITDMTMPRMTGLDLSKRLLRIKPDIPIVLCTGFSAGLKEEETRDIGIREIIMKPVIAGELADAVASALNLK